jgi:hypothetical protein
METAANCIEISTGTQLVPSGPSPSTRDGFTKDFTNAMKKGVEGIIEAGNVPQKAGKLGTNSKRRVEKNRRGSFSFFEGMTTHA